MGLPVRKLTFCIFSYSTVKGKTIFLPKLDPNFFKYSCTIRGRFSESIGKNSFYAMFHFIFPINNHLCKPF